MTKKGKTIWTLIAILVPLGIIISVFFWGKSIWDKLSFSKPYFVSFDMHGLTLADIPKSLILGNEKRVDITLGLDIKNDSSTSISFSCVKAKFYYEGALIGETSDSLSKQRFVAKKHDTLKVTDTTSIILNQAGGKLLLSKLSGGKPQIEYKILVCPLGIPIPIPKNNFIWS